MSIKRYLLAGVAVGLISVVYNFLVFSIFQIYPDLSFDIKFLTDSIAGFYLLFFLKNFFVGLILMVLFSHAYQNIVDDKDDLNGKVFKGVFFFSLYGIFALVSFTLGDLILMESNEGLFVLITLDGFVETLVATIPIRLFVMKKDIDL